MLALRDTLTKAFSDAISDRLQFANDNHTNAPEFSATARAQAKGWQGLRGRLLPSGTKRITRQKLRTLSEQEHDDLMNMLYFATIARRAIIEANKGTFSVASDIAWLNAYKNLFAELAPVSDNSRKSEKVVVAHRAHELIPDERWQETECGGKVFIPKLPK